MIVEKILGFLAFLLLSGCARSEYNLTVVHISDFHSHWFEFNDRERKCSDEESKAGKCFGGFPRLLNLVRDIRKNEENVIVLSSGEFFLGRSLNALHGWKIANALLPKLELDAMSLSNHDFSNGVFEISTFLYGMNFPVLCANMWARETSFLYSRVNKSVVLDINGEKIGIVGYVHPETLEKSRKAVSVKFYPEIPAIKKEVERLESYGINKILALGHSGYYTDLDIAKNVNGVDIVIGGNSDIVLEKPYDDDDEVRTEGNIHGNYPRVHHPEDGNATEAELKNRTLVLHIPQHGKYVGVIRVTFDEHGRVIREKGTPVLLDSSIPQDAETLNYLKNAHSILEEVTKNVRLPDDSEVLAQAEFEFESRRCRMQECSLGNLVTDAMQQVYKDNKQVKKPSTDPEKWGHVDAVVFNAGSIRYPLPDGNITIKDLVHSLFVGDFMKIVYMDGKQMVKMMEHSVEKYDPTGVTAPGSFLQISGLRVLYDLSNMEGKRVKKLLVRCENCAYDYEEVDPQETYYVAMPEFIARGGDGYPKFQKVDPKDFGQSEILLIVQYLRKRKIIRPALDGRITFLNEPYPRNYAAFTKPIVSNVLSTSSTRNNIDSSLLVTPIQGPKEKITQTSTIAKSEKVEISPKTKDKQTIKKKKSSLISLSPEFEKINSTSKIPALEKDQLNSASIKTTSGTQNINSTALVTPQSMTKSMEARNNNSKIYHVSMEKSYSYVSLMLGQDLEYPTEKTYVEKFLKSGDKYVSERNPSNENFPGITTKTKPVTKNTIERDTILSLKNDDVRYTSNLSLPFKRKTEENTENILDQNHATVFSTRQNFDTSIQITVEDSSVEKTWYGNNTANVMNNSSPIRLSVNNTDPINEFVSPDIVANFSIGESEVFDVVLKEESTEDTTNSQEVTSASINSSEEILSQKNHSKLDEVKSKFSSLVKNSSLSELEKILINAALAEVNENSVIMDDDDMERISNNLKTGMSSFLQDKITVTTMTSVDEELATIIRNHFDRSSLNATQSPHNKEPSEVNPITQAHFAETLVKESVQASTETINDKKWESDRILNESIKTPTNYSMFQNLTQISDLNKKHVDEIKDLLVNSVVNSVLDKMKTDIGHNSMDVNSPDISNNSEDIVLEKRRVVKKQLKPLSEEMTSSTAGKINTDPPVLKFTYDIKTNTQTHEEISKVSTKNKLTGSKITAETDNRLKDSLMKSISQNQEREDNHTAEIDLEPWKILRFK